MSNRRSPYSGRPRGGRPQYAGEVPTGSNFVPSFSVMRFADDVELNREMLLRVGKLMKPRRYWLTNPAELSVKALAQKRFVDLARDAGAFPDASDMRDVAYSVRDEMAKLLDDSPPGIELPLGQISRFGDKNRVLGVEPLGWRGHGARYAVRDGDGELNPVGLLAAEGQLTMDALTVFMNGVEPAFDASELGSTPHLSICRRRSDILEHDLRMARVLLEGELEPTLPLGDPVIHFKPAPNEPTEIIPVRASLGVAA